MTVFTLEVRGLDEVIRELERWTRFDKRGLMQAAGETGLRQLRRRISGEKTSPDGRRWAPLKASTVARKGNANIMIHHGRLLGSSAFSADANHLVLGVNVPYAGFHHTGTRKMVARPSVGFSRENESELERVMAAFVRQQLNI